MGNAWWNLVKWPDINNITKARVAKVVKYQEGLQTQLTNTIRHGMFLEWWNTTKFFSTIWHHFSCLLDAGIAKLCKKLISHGCFLSYLKDVWQQFFALPWSACKKQSWELNFFHIFAVLLTSRHEKCCQILERIFVLF